MITSDKTASQRQNRWSTRKGALDPETSAKMDIAAWLVANRANGQDASILLGQNHAYVYWLIKRHGLAWAEKLARAEKARDLLKELPEIHHKPGPSKRAKDIIFEGLRLMDDEGLRQEEVEERFRKKYGYADHTCMFSVMKNKWDDLLQEALRERGVPDLRKYANPKGKVPSLYVFFCLRRLARRVANGESLQTAHVVLRYKAKAATGLPRAWRKLWKHLYREARREVGLPKGVYKRTHYMKDGQVVRPHRNDKGNLVFSPYRRPGNQFTPSYDKRKRELSLGANVIWVVPGNAKNVHWLLRAFEESNWETEMDDPLPQKPDMLPPKRLHETLKVMNRAQSRIRFGRKHSGTTVTWKLKSKPETT